MKHVLASHFFVVSLLCSAATAHAAAATVGVLPVKATNLSTGEQDAIGVLFAEAYAAEIGAPVVSPMDLQVEIDAAQALETAASRMGLAELIEVSLVRLESKITVRATRMTPDGTVIHNVRLTAMGLDDMDQAASRACRALARQTSVEAAQTLSTVTRTETRIPNRTFSEKVMGIKTQIIAPVARGTRYDAAMSLQFDGRLEGTDYFLEFAVGLLLPTFAADEADASYGGLIAEIGGSWYLMNSQISPYIGGGVAPRLLFSSDDGGPRMALYGQVGLMFMRQSSSRLYTDIRVAQNVIPIEANNHDRLPTELTLAVGIGW